MSQKNSSKSLTLFQSFDIIQPSSSALMANKGDQRMQSFKLETKHFITPNVLVAPIEYWTTIFGFSIGYGCLWRFPYFFQLCGGAVFFIPFLLFFFLLGVPLLTVESSLGQIFKAGPNQVFTMIKRKMFGLGLVSVISAFTISVYFTVIQSWCIYFFFVSFSWPLPWDFDLYDTSPNKLLHIDFFSNKVLDSSVIHSDNKEISLGPINNTLLTCLGIAWILIFFINFMQIKLNSKFLYFTSISPIVLIGVLLISCFNIPGFSIGFVYFCFPDLSSLFDYKIWLHGCNQAIFCLSLGMGSNILFSSKKSESEDIYKRSYYIGFTVLLMGLCCIFINCIYFGFISQELTVDIKDLPFNQASLPFIVYPLAIGMMSYSNLWSLLFFGMMIMISLQTQMIIFEALSQFISETITMKYLSLRNSNLLLCIIGFACAIPFVTQNGFFLLEWVDRYCTMIPLFIVVLIEAYTIMKHIGMRALREIIANKTGKILPGYVLVSFGVISPLTISALIFFAFLYHLANQPANLVYWILQWTFMVLPFVIIVSLYIKMKNNESKANSREQLEQQLLNNSNTNSNKQYF